MKASPYSRLKRWRKRAKWLLITVIGVSAVLYPFWPKTPQPDAVAPDAPSPVSRIPDFDRFSDVKQKKRAFFQYLQPVIEKQNERILEQRLFVLAVREIWRAGETLTPIQNSRLETLAEHYEVAVPDTDAGLTPLLERLDIVPEALVLVQAANESAWGTSRFARQGYNFFGMWCFSRGCGFVPKQRNQGASHEVAKFDSLEQAVAAYLHNINTNSAYADLRTIRARLRQLQRSVKAERLAQGLMRYSQRGQAYIDELLLMIRINRKYFS
ncbi:Protein bax [Saliniradius amylolyticus]|uniref:Protein bax n=1 Tax=Saliniradius amylolyticus TaxID=2183582 RepID=A0A2S2E366_9ALTE|nr:glucosaminidase domain-containing protein [Saliniradius amylolyticus]AWL11962.1 Protein bax [Saliniradius amylolyticus]